MGRTGLRLLAAALLCSVLVLVGAGVAAADGGCHDECYPTPAPPSGQTYPLPTPDGPPSSPPELARTGSGSSVTAAVGGGVLLAGGGLLLLARRRRAAALVTS